MTATDFTPDQLEVRKAVYAAVLDERRHNQGNWIIDSPMGLLSLGLISEEDIPTQPDQRRPINVCGTAGCVAGHAVMTQVEELAISEVGLSWSDVTYPGLEWIYRGGKYTTADSLAEAVASDLNEDYDEDYDYEEDSWHVAGSALLGLDEDESHALFDSYVEHEHVVFLLQRLVAGESIIQRKGVYGLVPIPEGWTLPAEHRAAEKGSRR